MKHNISYGTYKIGLISKVRFKRLKLSLAQIFCWRPTIKANINILFVKHFCHKKE
jgi:hypothetical protein